MSWDDEYLTVNEIAEHLKLNPRRCATGFSAHVLTFPAGLADVVDGAWTHRRTPRWRSLTHGILPDALNSRRFDAVYSTGWSRWVSAVWRRPAPGVRMAWASARRDPTRTMSCLARVMPV